MSLFDMIKLSLSAIGGFMTCVGKWIKGMINAAVITGLIVNLILQTKSFQMICHSYNTSSVFSSPAVLPHEIKIPITCNYEYFPPQLFKIIAVFLSMISIASGQHYCLVNDFCDAGREKSLNVYRRKIENTLGKYKRR